MSTAFKPCPNADCRCPVDPGDVFCPHCGAALDVPGAREAVRLLDAEAAARSPFADLAGRIHLLVRRPQG